MARRRRSYKNRDLPPNLQLRNGGYFCYRDPRTGKEYGIGRDKREAITEAISTNMVIYGLARKASLLDRINGTSRVTLSELISRYLIILERRNIKPKTMTEYKGYLGTIKGYLGEYPIQQVETKDIAVFLEQWGQAGKATMANKLRMAAIDLFREAIAEGIITQNPAEATRNQRVTIRRERITLEEYDVIRDAADTYLPAWIAPYFDLALVTGQRLGDIQALRWENFKDGRLYIKQEKTTLYTILCKCLFSEVTVQAVTELDNKAAHCHAPVPQRHCPFL
ncbi:phage integrase Arm DNA-binding domain-containing protein [Candidatus Sodalis pierantonius]|uniref:phage integrase Arm DNA-binding domain-containing protein n=1 Tax=Candidatus Sodalis pierantonii TaxID=1486991 RepID=UPI000900558A|nr:phage integrase Arm DNA-binding domain-containing protein [Candidatus Sodalis pierantonius]